MRKNVVCLWALLLCLLAAAPAAAEGLPGVPALSYRYGDARPRVLLLQNALVRLGVFDGAADGTYGRQTVSAVEQYQRDRGLPVNGIAGGMTLFALFAQAAVDGVSADPGSQAEPRNPVPGEAAGFPRESNSGARGSHVLQLQQALAGLGYLPSGAADGVFSDATLLAVLAFQHDRGLPETGRADRDTLWLLFVKPRHVPGDTQLLYWYDGGSFVIPAGAVFEVQDVRTGIVFTCRRLGGVSHLDAEPLTPFDTLAMKQAYGGEWSWDRRPVLLRYQNEVYAASMNGMPHSWETIPGNRMDGHFCIHFFGSRIDTSQRVDADHLQCAFEASFARWNDPSGARQP